MITLQERVHGITPPKNWHLNKLHHVLTVRKGNKNNGMVNDNLLSLSYGRIIRKNIDANEGLLPESFETYQIVEPGDVVMRLTDLQNDKRSIRQGLVKERGIITSAYDAVYPSKNHDDSRFWAYTLLALDLAKYYYSLGGGVRQSIKFKDFPNDWIYVPAPEIQKEIADFLDQETTRIDQLIEKKKQILKILKNQMESLVDEAFEGFDNRRLKTVSTVQLSSIDKHTYEDEIPALVCHYTDVYYNDIIRDNIELTRGSVSQQEKKKFTLVGGEVIITKDSETPSDIAIPSYVESCKPDTVCGYHLAVIKPLKNQASGKYIFWALKTKKVRDYFTISAQGVTRYGLPLGKIGACPIPYQENLQQQNLLADKLFLHKKRQLAIEEKIESSMLKLKSFRVSLVNEAVTGKLDIKEWKKNSLVGKCVDKIEALTS